MTDMEYAWRLGYDSRMDVALYGKGAFGAWELEPPAEMTDEEKIAWSQGWDDAADSLKVAAFTAQ